MTSSLEQLATYRRLHQRLDSCWPAFVAKRHDRLAQAERLGHAAEKVAEGILEDLFTGPLDWSLADVNYQVEYADLLLTRLGIKHLLVEVKRPGALAWSRHAVDAALVQAAGYARKQKVGAIAVSDGHMLYAADVGEAGLHDRAFVALDSPAPHLDLWWVSVDGIYRPREDLAGGPGLLPAPGTAAASEPSSAEGELLDSKYRLPARCFAYVGDPARPSSWHLPYRLADDSVDHARLPKAIEAILSNYRGGHVTSIPERAIPDVLVCLGRAAQSLGKMPGQAPEPAPSYVALARALDQLGRLGEVS
ncbi:MAG: hypothetical protein ABSD62_04735 [Candidatus Limnocylindrales bacterium]|jgi:hypothetical protein